MMLLLSWKCNQMVRSVFTNTCINSKYFVPYSFCVVALKEQITSSTQCSFHKRSAKTAQLHNVGFYCEMIPWPVQNMKHMLGLRPENVLQCKRSFTQLPFHSSSSVFIVSSCPVFAAQQSHKDSDTCYKQAGYCTVNVAGEGMGPVCGLLITHKIWMTQKQKRWNRINIYAWSHTHTRYSR